MPPHPVTAQILQVRYMADIHLWNSMVAAAVAIIIIIISYHNSSNNNNNNYNRKMVYSKILINLISRCFKI